MECQWYGEKWLGSPFCRHIGAQRLSHVSNRLRHKNFKNNFIDWVANEQWGTTQWHADNIKYWRSLSHDGGRNVRLLSPYWNIRLSVYDCIIINLFAVFVVLFCSLLVHIHYCTGQRVVVSSESQEHDDFSAQVCDVSYFRVAWSLLTAAEIKRK